MSIRTLMKWVASAGLILLAQANFAQPLKTIKVEAVTIPDRLVFTGSIEAINAGTVSAQTSGRVVQTYFDVGDLVAKDAILVQLRDKRQRAALQRAEAEYHAAQANFDRAHKEYIRISGIYKKHLVSKNDFDRAVSENKNAAEQVKAAEAMVKNAKEDLEFTKVRAPYSGIVQKRLIEVGESVQPGMPLYSGMSLEALRVKVEVPQKDIDRMRQYRQAIIQLPEGKTVDVRGKQMTFFAYANPENAAFTIRLKLPQGLKNLYPGMYVKVFFTQGQKQILQIPQSAVVHRGELTLVYVQEKNKIHLRQIRSGSLLENGNIEVLSGLFSSEDVVVDPAMAIISLNSSSH